MIQTIAPLFTAPFSVRFFIIFPTFSYVEHINLSKYETSLDGSEKQFEACSLKGRYQTKKPRYNIAWQAEAHLNISVSSWKEMRCKEFGLSSLSLPPHQKTTPSFLPCRPVVGGVRYKTPNLPNTLFTYKMGQKWEFVVELKWWGSKSPLCESPAPPLNRSQLRACPHQMIFWTEVYEEPPNWAWVNINKKLPQSPYPHFEKSGNASSAQFTLLHRTSIP